MKAGFGRTSAALALAAVFACSPWHSYAVTATATTDAFRLDLREGPRMSDGFETLVYSELWDGESGSTVTISQDGAPLAENLIGEGELDWSVVRNGTYTLTHTTYTNGVAGKVETATFIVTGRTIPLANDLTTVSLSTNVFTYDATEHRPSVTVTNDAAELSEGRDFAVSYTNNVNAGTAWAIVTGLGSYEGAITNGFTISPRPLPIVADAKSKTYGAADPALTYTATGLVGNDRVSGALVRDAGEAVGTYAIRQGTLTAGGNYAINYTGATLTITPATIHYASQGSSGTYCGLGFGITVDVSAPASGAAVRYSTSETGPWQDTPILYTNACAATPIWFAISAEGYASVTNSRTVAISPKQLTDEFVWLMLPPQDYVYDGTTKTPGHECGDGDPSLITEDDFEVVFTDNVNAGTATATFTGKRNYTGTVEEEFDILPRPLSIVADAKSKTYGAADPALTYTATGLVGNDRVSGALVRDAGEAVGTYAIRQGTLAASANYALSYSGADFTITVAKPLNVSASDGTDDTCVAVSWGAETGASHEVWRGAETDGFDAATLLGTTESGTWNDATAIPGIVYRYWVRAVTGSTASDPSEPDTGWRAIPDTFVGIWKEWDDNDNAAGYRPESVSFTLLDDGDAIATTNLSDATGWIAVWSVPSWRNGEQIEYRVLENTVPRAYEALVATNGLDTLRHARLGGDVWTENGWEPLLTANLGSSIWTTNGWETLRQANLGTLVQTTNRTYGTLFAVTNRFVAPTDPVPVIAQGWSGPYDGTAHGISVTCGEPGFEVLYGTSEAGPFSDTNPVWREAGPTQTVWFVASAPYFVSITNKATVAISQRPLAVIADAKTKVYGTADPSLTYTATGLVGSDTVTGALERDTGEAVGTYAIRQGTLAASANYAMAFTGAALTITKATLPDGGEEPGGGTVPQGGVSKFDVTAMYDGQGHTIDTNALVAAFAEAMGDGCGFAYAFDVNGAADAATWAAVPPLFTNVCTETVWYRVTNTNYTDYVHAAKVTVTNRPVTVSVTGHTATYDYDTTEKTVTGYDATTADALYDIASATVFGGTASASRTDIGTTSMGLQASDFANNDANFLVAYAVADGGVTISPRVIGDDPANWDIRLARDPAYNGREQSAPITQVAFVKPDGNLDYVACTLTGDKATDAGNYVVRITGTGNYSGTVEKEWAIMPRNVTLTSGSATWTYDGAAHSETAIAVTGDGFVEGEGAAYSGFPSVTHVADAAEPTANAFTYALDANTKAGNYVIATANGAVQMLPRPITLTAPTKEKNYDGQALTFTAAEVSVSGDGYVAGEAFTLGGFSAITEAGQTPASFTVADGTALKADYAITVVPGTLTVKKSAQEITVTARSASWTYDGQTHVLHEYDAANLAALVAGDALEVSFDAASAIATPLDGAGRDGVVPNTISGVRVLRNGTADVTANYTLAWYPGTLTVAKRPVTLTSKSATKAYDGQPLTAHEATVGGAGFVGTDGATFTFTGTQTAVGTSANAFQYSLKAGTQAEYYAISKVEGELAVTPLDISGDAQDWVIELGPSLAYNGLPQIQTLSSVKYKGLDVDYSVTGNQRTDAGTYTMTIAGQGNFSGENTVDWSIAPKALTLTAGSGSRVYDGTALTVGTVTAEGFVAGEGATYTCDGSQTNAGSSSNGVATIAWGANTKASNYAVAKVAGTLTVTPRAATVASADISKPYDGTPLTLTVADITATGLVQGESFVYSGFASRTDAGQTPATFDYAAGPGTSLGNYTVTPSYGTITIAKSAAEIGVTAASGRWTYDGAAHSNRTYTATNLDTLQPGDALEVVFDPASVVTTPQDGPGHDGVVSNAIASVRVLRDGAEDVTANYTVTAYPGTLEVAKRPVVVFVAGNTLSATYDGTEKTASGYEATTADELYDIAADTAFTGASFAARTDAGTTTMGLAAADFANGNPCFDVAYQVSDGWVRVEKLDIASGAGADGFSIVLGANPKYNGTVQSVPVESVTCRGLSVTYTLAGENATHAGTYVLTVKANGNFTGERSITWEMLKRSLTMTSGSATKVYDGTPLMNPNVTVGGDGFIGLEGATFSVTGSQTAAGTSKNTFGYELKVGTRAGDYAVAMVEGDLTVTRATLPPAVFGHGWDGVTPLACEKVFNGEQQPVEIVPDFYEPYEFLWSLSDIAAASSPSFLPSAPTLRNVADGEITAYFKFVTDNYEPVCGSVRFRIAPKTLLDEMVVLTDEAFFYDPESGQKTPDVTVADTNSYGMVISTAEDYSIAYGDSSGAGAIPVIATGLNNYTGTVTKTFAVLKRPVAPPVIGSKAYNGRTLTASIATDSRWIVVANPGGVDAGLYTNVVLRLTNPDDYKWRGGGDDQTDWIGVFEIRRGANGWSRSPGIEDWTQGETPSTPYMGTPRNGSVSRILYRRRGTAPETGTETVPMRAGLYTARFVVDETVNYAGTYMDVDFEIHRAEGDDTDHTETTGVPVPYAWLEPYLAKYGDGDYEAAGNARGRNGCYLWESYLAGLDPENPLSRFLAYISLQPDGTPHVTWYPDLSDDAEEPRIYTVLGKASLTDRDWTPVTDANRSQMHFFKVKVELP